MVVETKQGIRIKTLCRRQVADCFSCTVFETFLVIIHFCCQGDGSLLVLECCQLIYGQFQDVCFVKSGQRSGTLELAKISENIKKEYMTLKVSRFMSLGCVHTKGELDVLN